MKKKLILVASPPACGKNYVSKLICDSLKTAAYLDKDDLAELLRCSFTLCGEPLDMDGEFYLKNLRPAEYDTLLRLAFSALEHGERVLVNAPFLREVRDPDYMRGLKERAASLGAELVLIWVTAPIDLCRERMQKRNSDRDTKKLADWEAYVKKTDYSVPLILKETDAVDALIPFDTADDTAVSASLAETLHILNS